MEHPLVLTTTGHTALVAPATLDGMAGAAIWASRLERLKTMMFAPEGRTATVFTAPALATAPNLRQLRCFNLPLVSGDLPAVETVLARDGLSDVVWLDHHYVHDDHVSRLQQAGAQLVLDPTYFHASRLLLDFLGDPEPWAEALVDALDREIEHVDEPWRSWLLVFHAVRGEPFSIRHAIAPLSDGRFEAYDPALRATGEQLVNDIRELAASPLHALQVGSRRLVVAGLPPSVQENFRYVTDEIRRCNEADLVLAFFDGIPRLVLATGPETGDGPSLLSLGDRLSAAGLDAYHYDRRTVFAGAGDLPLHDAIDRVLKALSG